VHSAVEWWSVLLLYILNLWFCTVLYTFVDFLFMSSINYLENSIEAFNCNCSLLLVFCIFLFCPSFLFSFRLFGHFLILHFKFWKWVFQNFEKGVLRLLLCFLTDCSRNYNIYIEHFIIYLESVVYHFKWYGETFPMHKSLHSSSFMTYV
jgi:hypothetical protein